MRELTVRAVVLGAVLSAILSAANAYLGLFAGMTVSASIPAAVVSMALLRVVRGSIVENNLVQTAASAGESAAAGAIFTLPAMILLGAWSEFDYATTALLVGLGGVLGVLFTVPLRRALIVEGDLPFPEGVATAAVLTVGAHPQAAQGQEQTLTPGSREDGGAWVLLLGASYGALAKLGESALALSRSSIEMGGLLCGRTFYFGMGVSPALAAVGFIVGWNVALLMLVGGLLNWAIAVPWVAEPASGQDAISSAWSAWSSQTRFLGVGAMTVGGLWTLIELRRPIMRALRSGVGGLSGGDIPRSWVIGGALTSLLPLFLVFRSLTGATFESLLLAGIVVVFGFLFCAVAAYMAGLVGSSNNPVSGVTIATILLTSLLLLSLGVEAVGASRASGAAAAILVGTVVCTAAAIGGDNMQDLKAGQLVGATPWKQQVLQLVGVLVAALAMAPVLGLLEQAYGFGPPTPEHPNALRAPQATLMASVAEGVFSGGLPWRFVTIGAVLALAVIVLDRWLQAQKSSFRTPVLALAVGIYLPLELSVPVALGGGVAALAAFRGKSTPRGLGAPMGLLLAAGLITGEALVGVGLAVALGSWGSFDVLQVFGQPRFASLGGLVLVGALALLFRQARRAR